MKEFVHEFVNLHLAGLRGPCDCRAVIIGTVHSKSVGKTTIIVHLAGWLDVYGFHVAVIDADWQEQCSIWLKATSPRITCHATQHPEQIVKLAEELRESYDVVIIDGPAGLHRTPGAVLTVSDSIIVPCGPTAPEIHALQMVADTVREVQGIRNEEPNAKPYPFIVPVKTDPRTIATQTLLDEASKLGFKSTKNTIPFSQSYARLFGLPGETPRLMWQLGRSRPIKQAVANLDALFQEMLPEAAADDPGLFKCVMSKPVSYLASITHQTEENEHAPLAANA